MRRTVMPYTRKRDLPRQAKNVLPSRAQEIYKDAYNSAFDTYRTRSKRRGSESQEEAASKVAWSAVKKKYKKGDDGRWHLK
jgi:cation transport regulator